MAPFSLFALAVLPAVAGLEFCDVAVVGGGFAGATAAVLLKDRNYNVCLFEKVDKLGGTCHTINVEVPAGCTGDCGNWWELGYEHPFINTTWQNGHGFGPFEFNTEQWIRRFVDADLITRSDYDPSTFEQNSILNTATKQELALNINSTAVAAQLARLLAMVSANWPWLESSLNGQYPDPLPADLVLTVRQFLVKHQMEDLGWSVFAPIGQLEKVTMLYAIVRMRRGWRAALTPGAKPMIAVEGGCRKLFEGIEQFLGGSVVYNAEVLNIWRPRKETPFIQVTARANGKVKTYYAKKLIIAIQPTKQNLKFLQYPDDDEAKLYAKVQTYYRAPSLVTLEGPKVGGTYTFRNGDPTKWQNLPATPVVFQLSRKLRYGPASAILVSNKNEAEPSIADYNLVQSSVNSLPPSVATKGNVEYVATFEYMPHFSAADLQSHPHPYTKWLALQGKRRTYYIGSLFPTYEAVKIWENTYQLIKAHFPLLP